ncbi:MAG: NapC/NirT family cytochrome c [Deltaproteobacteria bacterium]|jgi:nitrate/TMAO reductase-like tetraheme cytochrome c subunit|nr:NapC/NirT family cytochrome c [Deltaproteobacteria bacterium]
MGKKQNKYRLATIAFIVAVLLLVGTGFTFKATSSTAFCLSCHEMSVLEEELRYSPHAKDAAGQPISCSQCHLPAGIGPRYVAAKTYSGLKDVFIHFTEHPETLPRAALQPAARRFVDDANCMACHNDLSKNAKGIGANSEIGLIAHAAYLGKNGQAKSNCVGCHNNLAHLPEFDRRYDVNRDFTLRIQNKEALR